MVPPADRSTDGLMFLPIWLATITAELLADDPQEFLDGDDNGGRGTSATSLGARGSYGAGAGLTES